MEILKGSKHRGKPKAAQMRGVPAYPVHGLYPCVLKPEKHVFWFQGSLGLLEGVMVRAPGALSYAPMMVPQMQIATVRVHVAVDAFDPAATYRLRLIYKARDDCNYAQDSEDNLSAAERDKFMFEIPLEHIDVGGWFTCVLHVAPMAEITDDGERATGVADGIAVPCHPVLVRGTYLEIKG